MKEHKKKILIIDDDRAMSASIKRLLMIYGKYEIQELTDSNWMETVIIKFMPDLIILDVKMPGKGGYEICMHIKNNAALQHIKIMGVSGISGGIGAAFMKSLGADCYLEKPFDTHKFKKFVNQLIEV